MPQYIKCCKGCPDRWVRDGARCHDTCKRYLAETTKRSHDKEIIEHDKESWYYYRKLRAEQKDVRAKHIKRRAGSTKYM